jgi:hypothetical protein
MKDNLSVGMWVKRHLVMKMVGMKVHLKVEELVASMELLLVVH